MGKKVGSGWPTIRVLGLGDFEFRPCNSGGRDLQLSDEVLLGEIEEALAVLRSSARLYVRYRNRPVGGQADV